MIEWKKQQPQGARQGESENSLVEDSKTAPRSCVTPIRLTQNRAFPNSCKSPNIHTQVGFVRLRSETKPSSHPGYQQLDFDLS